MKKVFFLIIGLIILFACNDEFESPSPAYLNISLKYTDNDKDDDIDTIAVSVIGLGMDSVWIDYEVLKVTSSDTLRTVLLPLDEQNTNTDYIFILNGITDTVSFYAEPSISYESMETGFYYEFTLTDIVSTNHRIDNIEIVDSVVTQECNENIIFNINTTNITDN